MKDQYNSLQPQRQPGPLAEALGAKVEQFYALDHDVTLTQDSKRIGSGDIWAEPLDWTAKQQGSVLLRFQDAGGWLDGKPAMVERSIGRGRLIYLGALPDAATLATLVQRVSGNVDAKSSRFHAPPGVEICVRRGDSQEVVIVINHTGVAQQLALPGNLHAVLPTGADARNLYLASQSVAVFTQPLERNP
jgi:beta-galactosidase